MQNNAMMNATNRLNHTATTKNMQGVWSIGLGALHSTSGCNLLSFLDAYSGYHQIFMSKEDEEKTLFITPCGTYCFIHMPFGLTSVGSTFARAVQIGFEPELHRNIEAYMDDIVVKTRIEPPLFRTWRRHLLICARST